MHSFLMDVLPQDIYFYVPHFIKLPNVIVLYADISSLSKTSNQLEKEEKKQNKTKNPCAGTHWRHRQAAQISLRRKRKKKKKQTKKTLVQELTGGIGRQLETKAQ